MGDFDFNFPILPFECDARGGVDGGVCSPSSGAALRRRAVDGAIATVCEPLFYSWSARACLSVCLCVCACVNSCVIIVKKKRC